LISATGANSSTNGTLAFITANSDASGFNERMRITSGGQVGIGITNPTYKLVVSNAGALGFEVDPTNGSGGVLALLSYDRTAGSYKPLQVNAEDIRFQTGTVSTEKMRITSGGELLINTTSDAGDYKLQVNGNVYATGGYESKGNYPSITLNANSGTNFYIQSTYTSNQLDIGIVGTGSLFTLTSGGAIKTAAPTGGTAKPWKLGEAGVTLGGSNTSGVRVEIDGTVYYLVTGYLP